MSEAKLTPKEVLDVCLDIGEQMIICNAETNRVEDTIIRICKAYSIYRVEVFAIKSLIMTTLKTENNETITESRRIYSSATDLSRLENLNSLSRYICAYKPSQDVINRKLDEVYEKKDTTMFTLCMGYILSSGAFCVFFGGSLIDGFISSLIGILIFFIDTYIKKYAMNQMTYTLLCCIISGYITILFAKLGLNINIDKIMIGDIMLFIPGVAVVNSIRDMLWGDILSGILRVSEAILIAVAIACGFAIPLIMGGI